MDRRLTYFLVLMSIHSALLITSTVAGSKVVALPFGLAASATVLSYMLTFVILDTIAELYGRRYARFVINIGLFGMFLSAIYFQFAIMLPPFESWEDQPAFEAVLGSSWRIWLGGWAGYLLSQNFDLWSFLKLKEFAFGRRSLAIRAWVSMLIGQLFDTIVFITVAFYGKIPIADAIFGQYIVKVGFAILGSPLVFVAVRAGRKFIQQR
jgi:queuosine precursor transporter